LNFRGKPMLRPAGLDTNFFVEQGLKDKRVEGELFSSGGEGGDIAALAYMTAALARRYLGRPAPWRDLPPRICRLFDGRDRPLCRRIWGYPERRFLRPKTWWR
jgi:hypothetical protein